VKPNRKEFQQLFDIAEERFTNNLHNSIYWWAERNQGRGRGRGRYRNRNRNRKRTRHMAFRHEKLDVYRAAIELDTDTDTD